MPLQFSRISLTFIRFVPGHKPSNAPAIPNRSVTVIAKSQRSCRHHECNWNSLWKGSKCARRIGPSSVEGSRFRPIYQGCARYSLASPGSARCRGNSTCVRLSSTLFFNFSDFDMLDPVVQTTTFPPSPTDRRPCSLFRVADLSQHPTNIGRPREMSIRIVPFQLCRATFTRIARRARSIRREEWNG
jgi:hypothetical protein